MGKDLIDVSSSIYDDLTIVLDPNWTCNWDYCVNVVKQEAMEHFEEKQILNSFISNASVQEKQLAIYRAYYVFEHKPEYRDALIEALINYNDSK